MDILLTHPYFLDADPTERRIMKPYPSLGILYLQAYLTSRGFSAGVFDSTFESFEAFKAHLERTRPPVVGISINMMTRANGVSMIQACKQQNILVVVGGPEVPNYPEQFLQQGADVAVIGEGELTLDELLPRLHRGVTSALHTIPGIVFRNDDGAYVRTPERPLIPDLDVLPDPDRSVIPTKKYIDTWRSYHGRGSVSLICARGCPFTCTWCSRSVFGESHRRRSAVRVVNEIEHIMETYHPDQLWFADDVFTINHRWFMEFHAEMKRRSIRVPFECISRADRLSEEIVGKMAELGSFRIWYGSESGSQRILDAMQRRVTVEKIREVTRLAQRHGIEAGLFVMLGYPGEEIEDIDATIEHLKITNPDLFLTTVAYPIKGTEFYQHVEEKLIPSGDWNTTTDRSLSFRDRHSSRFYYFATGHLVNEVAYHRLRQSANGSLISKVSTLAKSRAARAGMLFTKNQRT